MDSVKVICNAAVSEEQYVESLSSSPDVVIDDLDPRGISVGNIIDWATVQSRDPDI